MITAIHALIYAQNADEARAFFRDVLNLPFVEAHGGWLIFGLPPAELGIHPAAGSAEEHHAAPSGTHSLSLMCDDVHKTVAELKAKGVKFTRPVSDEGWGLLTTLQIPGAGEMGLYQPRHPVAAGMPQRK